MKIIFCKFNAVLLILALLASPAYASPSAHSISVQNGVNGSITAQVSSAQTGATVSGTAVPSGDYDIATVRYIYSLNGSAKYGFAALTKTASGYSYSFSMPDADVSIAAAFFSTTVWDGAVDLSWYDKNASTYNINTPAQLAGFAAIVNGMTDKKTPDYMIKGDASLISGKAYPNISLVGAGGGNVSDTVYTSTNDFAYKTVCLGSDLDMGGVFDASTNTWSGPNYTPVGGKYSMASEVVNGDSFVIDTRFNGVFDGQGHTVKNINCQRYAAKGFPYSMAVGLIGYLGGACDENGVKAVFDKGWQPAVRNVTVGAGFIYGRRMVGGVVGRTDVTNNGVILENCANFATVKNTDAKGVGGVLGTGGGTGVIRNCYNAGNVTTSFACPAGGICGSNGGMDIYNCYNIGKIDSSGQSMGRGIGAHDNGVYTVDNCYYLSGSGDDPLSPGYYLAGNKNISVHVTEMTASSMKGTSFLSLLNVSGSPFVADTAGINDGYPVLYYQGAAYSTSKTCKISVSQPDSGGTISVGATDVVKFGKVVDFMSTPKAGYKLDYYTENGKKLKNSFVTVTEDMTIGAVFSEVKTVKIGFADNDAFSLIVTRSGYVLEGDKLVKVKDYPVKNGDTVSEEDVITVKVIGYDDVSPADENLQYTDGYTYSATNTSTVSTGVFTVSGTGDVALSVTRGTEAKTWLPLADTSWYDKSSVKSSYTLTSPQQLAGLAALVNSGMSFISTTICLGNDISLKNTDGTSGSRLWSAIGSSAFKAFKGTFDGQGHTVDSLVFAGSGSYAGLFGCISGAVVKNVTVRGSISGTDALSYAAGICASASASTIQNCRNYADISIGGANAAGIASFISDGTTISSCLNLANITGSSGVGGILGISYTASDLVGNCENRGEIKASGGGTSGAGGIAGKICGTVSSCVNSGSVKSDDRYTGGLVGYSSGKNSASVLNSYNTGNVSGDCSKVNASIGGLVGYAQYITLRNCYSTGSVTNGPDFATNNIGAVIGRIGTSNCNYINCYYLSNSCAFAVAGVSDSSVVSMQTTEMKTADFASALSRAVFANSIYINNGYPILKWQTDKPVCTVTFTGDYSGSLTVFSGEDVELPSAPSGYAYSFTASGKTWTGKKVSDGVSVSVSKAAKKYTATFTADGKVIGTADFSYGDSTVKAPELPRKDGYTASWQAYKLGASDITVKAVCRQNLVFGGDEITGDGTYFVQFYSTGTIKVAQGVKAVLSGINGGDKGFDGLSVLLEGNNDLTLDSFKSTGYKTLLTAYGKNTLNLSGLSSLVGTSDVKDNVTSTVQIIGDTTIAGCGSLFVSSAPHNSAIYVVAGGSLTQSSGTLAVQKNDLLGLEGGAIFASGADVVISGGTFSGFTNSDNVSVIYAKSIRISGGSVTAISGKSPISFDSNDISITGGSVKAFGHSGNSMSINRSYYNRDSMPGYTGDFAVAAIGVGWTDKPSAASVDGKSLVLGDGHLGLSGLSGSSDTADNMLYLWLSKANHQLVINGRTLNLSWDSGTSSFNLSGASDIYSVKAASDSLQINLSSGQIANKHVLAAVYDASGKLLNKTALKTASTPLWFSGTGFKFLLIETDSASCPLSDFAYKADYLN